MTDILLRCLPNIGDKETIVEFGLSDNYLAVTFIDLIKSCEEKFKLMKINCDERDLDNGRFKNFRRDLTENKVEKKVNFFDFEEIINKITDLNTLWNMELANFKKNDLFFNFYFEDKDTAVKLKMGLIDV